MQNSKPSENDLWARWPLWDGANFRTQNFEFVSRYHNENARSTRDRIAIYKPRQFISNYASLLRGIDVRSVLEIGYLEGGMPIFLADMLPEAKIVGIDLLEPDSAVSDFVSEYNLSERIRYYPKTSQDDRALVKSILDLEFGDRPLDFVTDDASHLYEQTKASFETCFGYLRPGGKYVIEDWGWAHWNNSLWQEEGNFFSGTKPLTTLLFELTMLVASCPEVISKIEIIDGAFAVITRGEGLPHGEAIGIDARILTAGRKFVGFLD